MIGRTGRAQRHPLLSMALLLIASLSAGCATTATESRHTPTPATVVKSYFAAMNRRDLGVLAAWVSPDVEWFSVAAGERILEVADRDELAQAWRSYFARFATTRVTIESLAAAGDTVAVIERAEWRQGQDSGSRRSVGVFELEGGRIRRITYFLPTQ